MISIRQYEIISAIPFNVYFSPEDSNGGNSSEDKEPYIYRRTHSAEESRAWRKKLREARERSKGRNEMVGQCEPGILTRVSLEYQNKKR